MNQQVHLIVELLPYHSSGVWVCYIRQHNFIYWSYYYKIFFLIELKYTSYLVTSVYPACKYSFLLPPFTTQYFEVQFGGEKRPVALP